MNIYVDPPGLLVVIILFGAFWFGLGYWIGHDDGVGAGFDAGWTAGKRQFLALIDEIKAAKEPTR